MADQVNISLSPQILEDYRLLARYQQCPTSTLLRQILEEHWRNPGVQKLIERAKKEIG